MVRSVERYPSETIVVVHAKLRKAPKRIINATIHDYELEVYEVHKLANLAENVPFTVYDAENINRDVEDKDDEEDDDAEDETPSMSPRMSQEMERKVERILEDNSAGRSAEPPTPRPRCARGERRALAVASPRGPVKAQFPFHGSCAIEFCRERSASTAVAPGGPAERHSMITMVTSNVHAFLTFRRQLGRR
jgi:hypothetical protein